MGDKEKLSNQRNEVIEKFINIETIINLIISHFYFKRTITNFAFVLDVLYDEQFTFSLKRRILEKIISHRKFKLGGEIHDLNRLGTIRNYFVHCNQEFTKTTGEVLIPDPRNPDKGIDFDDLYGEFKKKEGKVTSYLAQILRDLGAEFKLKPEV